MRPYIIFLFCLIALNFTSSLLLAIDHSWIEIGENTKLIARTITKENKCPEIHTDGQVYKMHLRTSYEDAFLKQKITICEHEVNNAKDIEINKQKLKSLPQKVNRFAVIGDSGCEYAYFNKNHQKQKCDGDNWPYKKIADKIADLNPDFIIHTGDYLYRVDKKNNKTMYWYFFKEDFFDPSINLLPKAPFIFLRGNHEKCDLGGDGWFALLEPRELTECTDFTDPYNISINDLKFIVFDSAGLKSWGNYPEEQLEIYSNSFKNLYENTFSKHWLLIHHPILPLMKFSKDETINERRHLTALKSAFKEKYSNKITTSISGHYHASALIEKPANNFTQVIVGNSGTKLPIVKENKYSFNENGVNTIVDIRFGFTLFDRLEDNLWKATSYDLDGNVLYVTNLKTN